MTTDTRCKDKSWRLRSEDKPDGIISLSTEEGVLAVLMDIRDEMKKLNRTIDCPNFQKIPKILKTIRGNTARIPKGK